MSDAVLLVEALELEPLRTRPLPCVSVEWLVETAQRPTVDLPNAPAPVAPKHAGLKGNGSPVIQPGYRKGMAPANKGKRYPPSVLADEDVAALLAALPRTGAARYRNGALIVVLWRTALRIAEALALYPQDIDFERGIVTVRKGKGDKSGFAPIDEHALAYVTAWLDWRELHLGIDRFAPVFCTVLDGYETRAINSSYVRRMLKRLAVTAGVERRVTPHQFRHTLAAGLMDEGADIRVVSKVLRHSNIAVTANYVDHLPTSRAFDAVRARPWPLGEADRG